MKLNLDASHHLRLVTGYAQDHLFINKVRHADNLILTPDTVIAPWAAHGLAALCADDFLPVVALAPAVVLIGTGARQRFLHPGLLRPLIEAGIGFETMDLAAACRTYNILAGEGRKVAAALLLEP